MRSSDESDLISPDEIDLASLSGEEILELAKGEYGKRDGGHRSRGSILITVIPILVEIFLVMVTIGPMLADPLLLYVPTINENIKCLALDEKLKKRAIVLRSFTDVPFLLKILGHVLPTWRRSSLYWRLLGYLVYSEDFGFLPQSLIHNILAVLPIPQIVILIFLPTTRNSRSLNGMKFLNALIILQYVARASPTFTLCVRSNKDTRELSEKFATRNKIWFPGALNFILYILAGHVVGAFWYFFSVQRVIDCWISTCRSENGCNLSTLQCDNTPFRNVTLLNDLCPTNPPNPMAYDFGIFVDTLQSGIVGTTDFPQKLLMCFLWGLRNLSSFASNLNSSTYAWESIFVIFISISGLILFMYLLGHVQTFMQEIRPKSKILRQLHVLLQEMESMLSGYGLSSETDSPMWDLVREALAKDEDISIDSIIKEFNERTTNERTTNEHKERTMKPLHFAALKSMLMETISKIRKIRQRAKVIFPRIDFMLSEYGLRQMKYAIWDLVDQALEEEEDNPADNIFSLLPRELRKHMKRHLFLATLKKLPGLENKDRQVLDAIMEHLEPVNYADGSYIIREGEPLDRMLFITQGIALAYKTSTTGGGSGSLITTHLEKGNVYGEELIGWAATSASFSNLPISTKTVKSYAKVEVFVLMADHLQLVVSKQFNTQRSRPADTTLGGNDSGISEVV